MDQSQLKKMGQYAVLFAVGRALLRKPFQKVVKFKSEFYDPGNETYLIVANHTNTLDAAYLYSSFKTHYRVVMSDHLFENPVASFLLNVLSAPIISYQNDDPDIVYNEMLDTLKSGVNVSLYVEARVTDTGETGYISRRNATLVKEAGCGLITYRFKDGYFNMPRWSRDYRWGQVSGEMVHQFSPAQIAAMSEEEIYQTICDDLYFNAYDEQREKKVSYRSRHPAEHAEYVLYGCPKCQSIGHLHTKKDRIFCDKCGFEATVDEYGFWHSEHMPFDDIPSWDSYQKELVYQRMDNAPDNEIVLFRDEEQEVIFSDREHKLHPVDRHGSIACYRDHLTVTFRGQTLNIPKEKIRKIKYISKGTLVIVTENFDLRIKTKTPRAASKYVVAARYMNGKKSL